jgi:hypothetical protein
VSRPASFPACMMRTKATCLLSLPDHVPVVLNVVRQLESIQVADRSLSRLSGSDIGSHSLEGMSIAFPSRTGKDISSGNQLDIYKASLLNGIQVLSLQESAANSSSSPQINVSLGPVRDLLVDHYICQMMKMESLVWGRRYLSIFMLHFSSQDLYIWGDLSGHDCLQDSLRFF